MTPEAIKKLAALLSELPSLGPRQATRLAFHIASMPTTDSQELARTIQEMAKLKRCVQCFRIDTLDKGLCTICVNPRRDQTIVAVVEKETDVLTLEKSRAFKGRYLVMGDLPKDGILNTDHKRRLATLKAAQNLAEIIIAFSPTTYGDLNAEVVADALKDAAPKITRLARGIPTGGEIEFADEDTLSAALKNRN
jgi:recombination protein RecR